MGIALVIEEESFVSSITAVRDENSEKNVNTGYLTLNWTL